MREVAPTHVDAAVTDVRTLSVRLDPRGERACAFSDAVHMMEETRSARLPDPRTTDHALALA